MSADPAPAPAPAAAAPAVAERADPPAAPAGEAWKSHWEPDSARSSCSVNSSHAFSLVSRKHHCRKCGALCCDSCSMWRLPVAEAPVSPAERVCLACARLVAAVLLPALPAAGGEELPARGPVDAGVNSEEEVSGARIERGEAAQAVTGQANSKVTLTDCVVDGGIVKGGNGHVRLVRCVVRGKVALDIKGNNRVELVDCLVEGELHAVRLAANAQLTARNSVLLSTDPATGAAAVALSANAKATLEDSHVAGADGYIASSGNSCLTMTGRSTISCRVSPLNGMLAARCAVQGKSELASTVHAVGPVKAKAAAPNAIQSALGDKF